MDKVICDICGTEYPETEAQCPICGCAKIESVIPDNQAAPEEEQPVSERRGARFSKGNVNRRMRSAAVTTNSDQDHDYVPEDDDEDEEEQPPRSNIVLIGIVIVLLLAIIAVSTYIAVSFFGSNDKPSSTTVPSSSVQKPKVPCTDFQVSAESLTLESLGKIYNITLIRFPMNTTDTPSYVSSDPAVAAVTGNGQVTAMGEGSAVITITCGTVVKTVDVSCVFGTVPPTTAPTVQPTTKPSTGTSSNTTTKPTTAPVTPSGDFTIMIDNYRSIYTNDVGTFVEATIKVGDKHTLSVVDGNKVRQDVTWTMSKDGICTLSGGTFKGTAKGTVLITATLNGVDYTCKVTVRN